MKFFAGILLAAGSLLGTLQLPAQGRPAALGHELAQSPARESAAEPGRKQPAEFAAGSPGVPATELPAEFSAKAHAAASSLRMLPPEEFGLRWLQEEVNPYLRARRKLHRTMQERAAQQEESLIRSRQKYPHDLNRRTGLWGIGNTSVNNWSPFQGPDAGCPDNQLPNAARHESRQAHRPDESPGQDAATKTIKKISNNEELHKMAEKVQVNADKLKVLNAVMEKIEKDFGKGSIMRMNSQEVNDVPVIPTGSITLDMALGVGGYPKGRVVEIYGPESSGKTTLAIHAIAEAQKAGGIAAFIDAEHAFDSFYAQKLGVDVDNLLISQPDNGEQALEIADSLIRSSAIDIIVIDSVAALTPKAEIEGEMGDSKMGLQARLMSQALRKLTSSISKTKTVCIFINQLRDKIGVVYGNPETTTGGNALKFYASVRIDIRRMSVIKDGEEQLGTRTKVKVVKNKVAPPFKRAEFDIMFGEGISKIGEIVDLGVDYGVVKKAGSWFSYGDRKIGQGRDAVKELLKNDDGLRNEIEAKVREAMKAPKQ